MNPIQKEPIAVPLTKSDLVESIYHRGGFMKSDAVRAFEATVELIKATLSSGEDVLISGFGRFEVKEKDKRKGRNPQTGGDLMLRPRRVIRFKCSGVLKDKLNGKG